MADLGEDLQKAAERELNLAIIEVVNKYKLTPAYTAATTMSMLAFILVSQMNIGEERVEELAETFKLAIKLQLKMEAEG